MAHWNSRSPLVRFLLALLLLLVSAQRGMAERRVQPNEPGAWLPDPSAGILSTQAQEEVKAQANPKLDSVMAQLAATARVSSREALSSAHAQALALSGERIQVQIATDAVGAEHAARAVLEVGGEVTGLVDGDTLMQAWLPVGSLEQVAAHRDVHFIRRPALAYALEDPIVGGSTTEGLTVMNGLAWHAAGYTGAGVRVGIIDIGFQGYPALLGSDLPSSVTVKNFVDGEHDSQANGTSEHGNRLR